MKQLEAKVRMAAIAALALVAAQAVAADAVKSLAGEWRVSGEGIEGVVRLPGTLADAKLGRHKTAADWEADTNRASKGALTREWQYRGKAVYEREIELTEEEARHPLELVMERVMLYSELAIDGETVGSCDSLATEHVYPIPQRLTKPGRHTIRLTLDNSNRYNFSEWAHSYGPVMQSVWHGVVGEFALRRQSPLRKARVFASWPANGRLMVEVPEEVELKEGSVRLTRWTTSVRQQGCSAAEGQCCKVVGQQGSRTTKQQGISAAEGQCCKAAEQQDSKATRQQGIKAAEGRCCKVVGQQGSRMTKQQGISAAEGRCCKVGCEAASALKPPLPSSQASSCQLMRARAAQRQETCCCPLVVVSRRPSPYRKGFKLVELKLGREPEAWSEHHPSLYTLTLRDEANDFTHSIRFGFRSVSAHDHAIWINGYRWFMRGNLDCCHFPLTGAPDTTKAWWLDTFRKLRDEDGINTIRFHSWTPPKAAFDAADELGMFCVVEAGIWTDRWHKTADKMGFGKPVDGFVQRELRTILEMRGNSPSFISLGIGNELGGNDFKVMGKWMSDCRAFDPRRLYLASTARDLSSGDDYATTHRHPEVGMVRARFRPSTDWDYEDVYGRTSHPTVAHEIGQWPIYVDWKHELAKYTGVLRPYNLEHYRDVAVKSGTERLWPRFCEVSAKLNRLMYKDEVESFMRTPSCAGLQLLSVQDFTGQFEAMIGWRDSFYDLKPAVEGMAPFRDIFNELPHLARFEKYTWQVGETYKAKLVVRNLTEKPILEGTEFRYAILAGRSQTGQQAYNNNMNGVLRLSKTINPGEVGVVGEAALPLTEEMAGRKFTLIFGKNSWPFWVFGREGGIVHVEREGCAGVGARIPRDGTILETSSFDDAIATLAKGGRVLYTGASAKSAKSHFKPVYWSTGHFRSANAELSTLGYYVRAGHPALRGFPTEDWADWQWYNLVEGGVKHGIADLPQGIDPIVMPVPDLHYSTPMGMLFELKVGEGRLMVCGLNLSDKALPEVGAIRKGILLYMESKEFNPAAAIDMEKFKEAFAPQASASKLRPAQFRDAPVYIAAAVELDAAERSVDWKKALDFAEMKQGGYNVSGKGRWGSWRDSTGSFWHGQGLVVTLTDVKPVSGTLWVRFRDPNRNNRSGRGTCEGRPFTVPKHQSAKDGIWWAKLPVMREDFLDGKIELKCEAITGPNLMIDRVVLMEDK